jgi:RecJ-like exonuclease
MINWIIEVPAKIFDILIERGKVYMEWKENRVKEFINIARCFKCHGFGHIAKNYASEHQYCGHCGDKEHTFTECNKKLQKPNCICCIRSKRKNTEHNVRDKQCPEYIIQLERYKERISYLE